MDATQLSSAKLALLEKYRQGNFLQEKKAVASIQKRAPGQFAPLSFGQQQMWLLAQLIPDMPVYNESVTIRLPGPLNVTALEQSFNEVIRRHEVWRTSFPLADGEPVQMVHPSLTVELPVVDLRHLPSKEREPEAIRLATEQALPLFDLSKIPLLRATLVRLDDEDHRLYLTLHHILFDGVIYQVFLPELFAHYQAFVHGEPSSLPPLPIQYSDFALWQREMLQTKEIVSQLAYWKSYLEQPPLSLELPTDRPRPLVQSHRGARLPFSLSIDVVEALRTLSRSEGVTLYMTLVASFNTLLYRYTGQSDILIGTATAGRRYPEIRQLLGIFLNPLVLRTDMSGNPTFRELMGRVREVVLEAHAHQDIPFEYLAKELLPGRDLRQNPFVQVMLSLEPPLPSLPSGWTITQSDVEAKTAKFDLFLELDDRPDGFAAWLEYNTDIFDASTAQRIVTHWQMLLESIVAHPDLRLHDLSIMTEPEHCQILVEWNATQIAYPDQACVQQIFERQAESTPGAVALYFNEQQVTYHDLNIQANQLAHHLRSLGVGAATRVAICMDRSPKMVIGLLGILKAGGTYVPIDPTYPSERQAFILHDAKVKVLLTSEKLVSSLPVQGLHAVCLDTDWSRISQEHSQNLSCETTADDLAYIMYTSGSTGMPKGVEIRHRSIARLVFGAEYVRLDATRTLLHMAPISFDASTFELWGALLLGASCVLFSDPLPTPKAIASIIARHHVTTVWLTASLFNAVIDEAPEALSGVQQVLTGGEALSVAHVRRALALLPSTQFINGYGPTECTTFACCYPIPRQLSEDALSIPIGRPISNTEAYILDTSLHSVPVGVVGELYLGGDGLARGYVNRPDLTREKFIPHPFSKTPGAYLYKTGDLVRYLADGTIEFIGRIDQQLKLRGFRVEPGEIEVALGRHPDVQEAIVTLHKDKCGEKSLVSYVILRRGINVSDDELRQYLQDHLPAYMIPSTFVLLDTFPLTPNGKVDRNALPNPEEARIAISDTVVAPRSMEQQIMLQIWEKLLATRPIGIEDNFFHLGGNSLLAVRLVHRIELTFQKRVPLAKLIANPTIESLTAALYNENDASRAPVVTIQQGSKSKAPFFFLHGDPNGGAFYCFSLAQSLGVDQPFYACAPYRFAGGPLPTFEAMASAHIEAIRTIQPEGPYLLGGFCNGALVAYEMAHQLQVAKQEVDLLFLVDPTPPAHRKWTRDAIALFSKPLKVGQVHQLDWFLRLRYIYRFIRFSSDRARYLEQKAASAQQLKLFSMLKAVITPSVETLRQDWFELYRWLMAAYKPSSYSGNVTFVWTEDDVSAYEIWARTPEAQHGDVHVLHSGHLDWVTKRLDVLTELLHTSLSNVQ